MRRVVLHIDRLVVRGATGEDWQAMAESFRGELGRLLASRCSSAQRSGSGELGHVRNVAMKVRHGSQAEEIGVSLARSISGAIAARISMQMTIAKDGTTETKG
jgi:hypothetical protein